MKRTYPTNVDGQIFYIDEDAFLLLQNYLHQLKITFTGAEGSEIVADIESRIRELFNDKISAGKSVIVLADVNNVIETMGRPEDLNPEGSDTSQSEGDASSRATANGDTSGASTSVNIPASKKLYRNMKSKVFGGVLGGLAVFLDWNANIMRLLLIVLVIASTGLLHMWPFVLAYLVAWMIIPPAVTPRQILQMKGEPVNLDTVGQAVIENSGVTPPPVDGSDSSVLSTFFSIIGKCIMAFIGLLSGCVGVSCLIGFLCVLAGVIAFASAGDAAILNGLEIMPFAHTYGMAVMGAMLSGLMLAVVVFGMICWGCLSVLFTTPRMSRAWIVSLIVTAVMLLVLTIVLCAVAML